MDRRQFLSIAASATTLAALPRASRAQAATTGKPLHLIVPTPPGGASDAAARMLGQFVSKHLGEPVLVENRPGASGAIAAQALLAAPADGRTLLWTLASMSGLPSLLNAPPYRSISELTPVSIVGHLVYGLYVPPIASVGSVAELVEHARRQPQPIPYATGSLGDYMATTRFLRAADVQAVRVPYRGGSQLLPDLLTGRVAFNFGPLAGVHEQVRSTKLRMLAVLEPTRSPIAPEVPTMDEAGYAGLAYSPWQGLYAPPRTPAPTIAPIAKAVAAAMADPAVRAQYEGLAIRPDGSDGARLADLAARGEREWAAFVREHDIPKE